MRPYFAFPLLAAMAAGSAHAAVPAPAKEAMYMPLPRTGGPMPLQRQGARFMPLPQRAQPAPMAQAVPLKPLSEAAAEPQQAKAGAMSEDEAKLLLFIFHGAD